MALRASRVLAWITATDSRGDLPAQLRRVDLAGMSCMFAAKPDGILAFVAFFAIRGAAEVMRLPNSDAGAKKGENDSETKGGESPKQCGCFHRRWEVS
jgi:hypothetical protein